MSYDFDVMSKDKIVHFRDQKYEVPVSKEAFDSINKHLKVILT